MTTAPFASPSAAYLLERLATPERLKGLRDAKGRSLIMAAIEENDLDLVTFLAPRCDLLERASVVLGEAPSLSPLMQAARMGHTACVRALLEHQPEQQCAQGGPNGPLPALDHAVNAGHVDCVRLLAPFSNLQKRQRLLPMVRAAVMGRPDLVAVLLPHCPLNVRDEYGRSALSATVTEIQNSPQRDDCVRLLLQQPGVEVVRPGKDSYDNPTQQIAFDAIRCHQVNALRLLLPHLKVDRVHNVHSAGGWIGKKSPLHMAVEACSLDALRLLMPLSQRAFSSRQTAASNSYRDEDQTTPAELALARIRHSSFSERNKVYGVADELIAYSLRHHLPTPLPTFLDVEGAPMAEDDKQACWPLTVLAMEAQELERTIRDEVVPEGSVEPRGRRRL